MGEGLVSSWRKRQQRGSATLSAPPAGEFDFMGFGPPPPKDFGLENVFDEDDNQPVKHTADPPWRPIVMLRAFFQNEKQQQEMLIGSGLLIKPNVILTAAHNVYRLGPKCFVTSIQAYAGVTIDGVAGAKEAALRVQCPKSYTTCSGPRDTQRYVFDYALIHLASDKLGQWAGAAAIPDVPAQQPINDSAITAVDLTVAGFPCYSGERIVLRQCTGRSTGRDSLAITYRMDTLPGESGGPVFHFNKATKAVTLAGVHTTGEDQYNRARRYDTTMRDQISGWLSGSAGTNLQKPPASV